MKRADTSPSRGRAGKPGPRTGERSLPPDAEGLAPASGPTQSASEDLAGVIGLSFGDSSLLRKAMIHRSAVNEQPELRAVGSNERMEYLGDSVLDFIISDYLYRAAPHAPEGALTDMRAAIVREEVLAAAATQLDLGQYLLLGKGEAESGGRGRPRLLASAFEAVIGAVYLDGGLDTARDFLMRLLSDRTAEVLAGAQIKDAKSLLQEAAQARTGLAPAYALVSAVGPDHAPRFEVAVSLGDRLLGTGAGASKQDAEEAAARDALARWDSLDVPSR